MLREVKFEIFTNSTSKALEIMDEIEKKQIRPYTSIRIRVDEKKSIISRLFQGKRRLED